MTQKIEEKNQTKFGVPREGFVGQKIEYRNPKDLKENAYSRKFFPKLEGSAYELLRKDIIENNILTPLSITKDNLILRGNERCRVALEIEMKEVPVIIFGGTDDTEQKIWILTDNLARKDVDFNTRYVCGQELKRLYGLKRGEYYGKANRSTERFGGQPAMTDKDIENITKISRETSKRAHTIESSDLPENLKRKALLEGEGIRPIAELTGKPKKIQQKVSEKVGKGMQVSTAIREAEEEECPSGTCSLETTKAEGGPDSFAVMPEEGKEIKQFLGRAKCPHCKKEIEIEIINGRITLQVVK